MDEKPIRFKKSRSAGFFKKPRDLVVTVGFPSVNNNTESPIVVSPGSSSPLSVTPLATPKTPSTPKNFFSERKAKQALTKIIESKPITDGDSLREAIESNSASVEEIKTFLERQKDLKDILNKQDEKGFTAIQLAAMHGAPEVLELFLTYNPEALKTVTNFSSSQQKKQRTIANQSSLLHLATYYKNTPIICYLCELYFNELFFLKIGKSETASDIARRLNLGDLEFYEKFWRPLCSARNESIIEQLFIAIANNDSKQLRHILATKIEVNFKNSTGDTPLHVAIQHNQVESVKLLLEFGANQELLNREGLKPIELAARMGCTEIVDLLTISPEIKNTQITQLLITAKAPINALNHEGNTPLQLAAKMGNVGVMKLLLATNKAKINVKNPRGNSALHFAALSAYVEPTRLLLEQKADVGAVNKEGNTPLHLAAESGNAKVLKLLLQANASSINAKNTQGETALHRAARNGHLAAVKVLQYFEADTTINNAEALSAAQLAARAGHNEITKQLTTCGFEEIFTSSEQKLTINPSAPTGLTTKKPAVLEKSGSCPDSVFAVSSKVTFALDKTLLAFNKVYQGEHDAAGGIIPISAANLKTKIEKLLSNAKKLIAKGAIPNFALIQHAGLRKAVADAVNMQVEPVLGLGTVTFFPSSPKSIPSTPPQSSSSSTASSVSSTPPSPKEF